MFACRPEALAAPMVPGWGEIPFERADALDEALSGKWRRKHAAVLGGDALACDLAWSLLSEGLARKVLLITENDTVLSDGPEEDRAWFLHLFTQKGGTVLCGCRLLRLRRHTIFYAAKNGAESFVRCDRIVLAERAPAPLRLYEEALRERLAPKIILL